MGENSPATPKAISNILKEVSMINDFSMKSRTLDFYAHLLQEEIRKLDALKRELPQSMYLVQDVIELLKEESLKWKTKEKESITREQFIPLKKNHVFENGGAKKLDEASDKMNWLRSARLWSTTPEYENPDSGSVDYHQGERSGLGIQGHGSGIGRQGQGSRFQSKGSAFVPFKRSENVGIQIEEKKVSPPPVPVDGISLNFNDVESNELNHSNSKNDFSGVVRAQELHEMYLEEDQQRKHKKQRRCWSPELHNLFVDALNQLGGLKSATPKMIWELMKVDGLTSDEVKSHLQKYKLHVKKFPSSSPIPSKLPSWLRYQVGSSGSPHIPFHNGSGLMKMGSGTSVESMDEDENVRSESQSWVARSPVQCETGLGWLQL